MYSTSKSSRGFTLIEVVTSLVILGFVALSIGNGLVYSAQLYRMAKIADSVMLQLDVATTIIRRTIKNGDSSNLELDGSALKLKIDDDAHVLLDNVKSFEISPLSADSTVKHVTLKLAFGESDAATFEFDVFPES